MNVGKPKRDRDSDLAPLLSQALRGGKGGPGPAFMASSAPSPVSLRQGTVIEFNNDTGENKIDVGGAILEDLDVVGEVEPLGIQPGDVVSILRVGNAWMVLGRVRVSGGATTGGGIQYLGGPTPPKPTTPVITPVFQGLKVAWDGLFDAGAERTVDWSRVEVHVSSSAANTATQQLTFDTGTDGVTIPVAGDVIAATSTYTAAGAIHGPLAMRSTNTQFIRVQNTGTATHTGSVYLRIPDAQASGAARLVTFTNSVNGNLANLRINNLGQIQVADSVNSPQVTSTAVVATNTVARLDWQWDDSVAGSMAAPVITARVFLDPDATEPDDIIVWTAAGLATAQNRWVLGALSSTVAWVSHLDTFRAQPGLEWLAPYATSFTPDASTFRASIEAPDGGEATLAFLPDSPAQYVRLVSRSLAGKSSEPSPQASGIPGTIEEFIGDIGQGTRIFYGPDTPVDPVEGELWYHETGVGTGLYVVERYVGGVWEPLDLEGVAEAIAEAIAAQTQVRFHAQNDPPAGTGHTVGDLWTDTNDGNRLYSWDGDSWEPHAFGNGAIEPGSLIASNVIATGTISTALLEAQAVTADKMAVGTITADSAIIAEAAIVDANITDLNAGKLTAGTMNAEVVIGNNIRTAVTGSRVEMGIEGLSVYDGSDRVIYLIPDNDLSTDTYLATGEGFAWTPDAADLDITGDLDLRVRLSLDDWQSLASTYVLGKATVSGQLSYYLAVSPGGKLRLGWSANGTAFLTADSTSSNAFAAGSVHWVRATLDVNNLSGGRTITFYTADDAAGASWTQLGTTVVQSLGTTSVFASTTQLTVGARGRDPGTGEASNPGVPGRVYAAQVRSGIGGTIVANPDFTTRTPGDTSWTDGAGRTWEVAAPAEIISQFGAGTPEIGVVTPSTGNSLRIYNNGTESVLEFQPQDVVGITWERGQITSTATESGGVSGIDQGVLAFLSPYRSTDPGSASQIALVSGGIDNPDSYMNLVADYLIVQGRVEATSYFRSTRPNAADGILAGRTPLDLDDRILMRANGQLRWGPGSGAQDTTLERTGVQNLASNAMLTSLRWYAEQDTSQILTTTYGSGANSCAVVFTAPSTGAVKVSVGGLLSVTSDTAARTALLAFEIRTGSSIGGGSLVFNPAANANDDGDIRALRLRKPGTTTSETAELNADKSNVITGLTAGSTYHARTMHRNGGGTGSVTNRRIFVEPW